MLFRSLLRTLLEGYNDGRKKTLYCLAVNLLEVDEVKGALQRVEEAGSLPDKERAARMAEELHKIAEQKGIELKLRRRK